MSYFNNFPKLLYSTSLSTQNAKVASDVFQKVSFIKDVLKNSDVYYKYRIKDGETAERIAFDMYKDPSKHWIILLANDIVDPQYDWPLQSNPLNDYINKKYSSYNISLDPDEYHAITQDNIEITDPVSHSKTGYTFHATINNGTSETSGTIMTVLSSPGSGVSLQVGMVISAGGYYYTDGGSQTTSYDWEYNLGIVPICTIVEKISAGTSGEVGSKWRLSESGFIAENALTSDPLLDEGTVVYGIVSAEIPDILDNSLSVFRGTSGELKSSDGLDTRLQWNVDGWSNLYNVESRSYTDLYTALDAMDPMDLELVMKDSIEGKYYKVTINDWDESNGGFWSWDRCLIYPNPAIIGELIYQGGDRIDQASAQAIVIDYEPYNRILQVNFLTEVLSNNSTISSSTFNEKYTIIGLTCNDDGVYWATNTVMHYELKETKKNTDEDITTYNKYKISLQEYDSSDGTLNNRDIPSTTVQSYTLNDGSKYTITKELYPVSYYDYEIDLNEEKRNIVLPKVEYVAQIQSQFMALMR